MREIKFRAWDHEDKKMWKVIAFSESIWGESEEPNITICDFGKDPTNYETEIRNSTNYELMQYTGLKDKNGEEIFEGDIVQFKSIRNITERYEVEYTNYGEWAIGIQRLSTRFGNCEVIGNIYENPDLLEEAK